MDDCEWMRLSVRPPPSPPRTISCGGGRVMQQQGSSESPVAVWQSLDDGGLSLSRLITAAQREQREAASEASGPNPPRPPSLPSHPPSSLISVHRRLTSNILNPLPSSYLSPPAPASMTVPSTPVRQPSSAAASVRTTGSSGAVGLASDRSASSASPHVI